ncbi:MAG TPA: hypothetical protein VGI36_21135 [Candidatus Binataceae bacterium]
MAGDAPASETIPEKVPVLREVSLPMHLDEPIPGYAKFEVAKPGLRPLVQTIMRRLGLTRNSLLDR